MILALVREPGDRVVSCDMVRHGYIVRVRDLLLGEERGVDDIDGD